jgi:hypothetical protein
VRLIAERGELGEYDPIPPIINLASGVAWVLYAVRTKNYFLLTSGSAAVAGSAFAILIAHANAPKKVRGRLSS